MATSFEAAARSSDARNPFTLTLSPMILASLLLTFRNGLLRIAECAIFTCGHCAHVVYACFHILPSPSHQRPDPVSRDYREVRDHVARPVWYQFDEEITGFLRRAAGVSRDICFGCVGRTYRENQCPSVKHASSSTTSSSVASYLPPRRPSISLSGAPHWITRSIILHAGILLFLQCWSGMHALALPLQACLQRVRRRRKCPRC